MIRVVRDLTWIENEMNQLEKDKEEARRYPNEEVQGLIKYAALVFLLFVLYFWLV